VAVSPIAVRGGEGDRREPRPGRSGCPRVYFSSTRSDRAGQRERAQSRRYGRQPGSPEWRRCPRRNGCSAWRGPTCQCAPMRVMPVRVRGGSVRSCRARLGCGNEFRRVRPSTSVAPSSSAPGRRARQPRSRRRLMMVSIRIARAISAPSGSRRPGRAAPSFREGPRPSGGGSWQSGGSPIWGTSGSAAPSQR